MPNLEKLEEKFGIENENGQDIEELSEEVITELVKMPSRIKGRNQITSKKKVIECPHTDRKFYAKGMCVNCYHRRGRTKKAWKCAHTNKMHYSKGLCKFCYLASYYKSRTCVNPMEHKPDEEEEEEFEASHHSEKDMMYEERPQNEI